MSTRTPRHRVRSGNESRDLHGMVPDEHPVALLVIDMISDFDFPGGDRLLTHALPAARRIAALKACLAARGVPTVYVNDNFGRWRSSFPELLAHCLDDARPGAEVVRLLAPAPDDYFVLKPKHSGFFGTTLEIVLDALGARRLVLTGMAGDACVQFTAADAYLREYELWVPADCVASQDAACNDQALAWMGRVLKARTAPARDIDEAFLGA